ncbi:MAG: glycosyltransferase [Planctomycetota bacterium]
MRSSLILAAHNEGDLLWRTLESMVQTSLGLQFEIVVADDASWDGCVAEAQRRFPEIRLVRHDERRGASPTKDLGARHARGDVLIFLDSHVKPELGALERLVEDVELCHGEAMITPAIGRLDPDQWRITDCEHLGHGYWMDLETLDCRWLSLADLREHPRRGRLFYETPALIGCAFAIHRDLYEKLRGFDPHMFCWGAEDLDLGLKGWLLGHPVLHDPQAVIGHRFQQKFENFQVPVEQLIANQMRLARKNFTESVWADWADRCRRRYPGKLTDHPEGLWARAWSLYSQWQASVEYERSYLQARRVHDEFWYADRFGMNWPRLQVADAFTEPPTTAPLTVASESVSQPEPVPSPSDFSHWVDAIDDTYTIDVETDQAAGNVITSENSDDGLGNDTYDGIPIVDPSNYTTTLIEAPKHGQVTLDEHGNFIYTPDDGSTEPDSFTYELSAPGGLTDQATVNVLGLANNDHEPKFDGPYTVEIPEDTAVDTVVITVVATDADADSLAYSIIALLNRIYAYPSAYFTIYEGIVIAVRPDGATDDEPAAVDQSDLAQRVHDCYCIAALIAAARAKPSQIEEMIEPLGNGSFRVNFADAPAQTIQLELDRGRDMVDLGPADADEMGNVEVWAVIMERAVAQMRQSEEGGGALFDALAGGDSGALYKKMTGRKAIPLDPQKWQVKSPDIALARARDINRWIRAGTNVAGAKPQVMLSTLDTGNTNDRIPPGLLFDHVYVVRSVDMQSKVLHLIDPLRPSDDIETSFGWLGAMKDGESKYLKYGYHCE